MRVEKHKTFTDYVMQPINGVIKFHIYNFLPEKINKDRQILLTQKALNQWGKHLGVTFIGTSEESEALIKFYWWTDEVKELINFEDFDGPMGVLGRALITDYRSSLYGHIHFDPSENWIYGDKKLEHGSIDFFTVMLHEIGHILGIAHSEDESSILYPAYTGPKRELTQDDIDAALEIKSKYKSKEEIIKVLKKDILEQIEILDNSTKNLLKIHDFLYNKLEQ